VSLFDGEIGTLIPWTLFDIMEHIDVERDRTRLYRIEVKVWELEDDRCLQYRGSSAPHSSFHLFALQVYAN
jgi:hypothetical protein